VPVVLKTGGLSRGQETWLPLRKSQVGTANGRTETTSDQRDAPGTQPKKRGARRMNRRQDLTSALIGQRPNSTLQIKNVNLSRPTCPAGGNPLLTRKSKPTDRKTRSGNEAWHALWDPHQAATGKSLDPAAWSVHLA
jgi:hypothetical protein